MKSPDPELDDPDRTDDISGDGEYTEIENSGDLDIENNDFFGPSASLGSDKGLPGPGAPPLKYPVAMNEKQDHIEFRMVEYSPRKFTKSDQLEVLVVLVVLKIEEIHIPQKAKEL